MSESLTGKTVTHEQIPAKDLTVDPSVQRTLDPKRAQRIADNFDVNAMGVVTVSRRANGVNHIVDGQHRQAVLILLGQEDELMDCHVHTGLTLAEEARMFRLLNAAKPPTVLERFLVRVQEGDPVAVDINDALDKAGWRIGSAKIDGMFAAVASIEAPYVRAQRAGENARQVVDWILQVCNAAFGRDSDGVRGEIVSALGYMYLRYGSMIDTKKLVSQMAITNGGARGLISKARQLREFVGGTVFDSMAQIMVGLINKGRHVSRQIPEWKPNSEDWRRPAQETEESPAE